MTQIVRAPERDPLPPWFDEAVKLTREFQASTRGSRRARHSVYTVLLHDPEAAQWGLYVGMTGLSPEQRFWDHRCGHRCGRGWVTRYGVTLAPALFTHLNLCEMTEAQDLEQRLLEALPNVVPWVQGH